MILTNTLASNISILSHDNNSIGLQSPVASSDEMSSIQGSLTKRKRKKNKNKERLLSPIQAKINQKKMMKKRNKSIATKKSNTATASFIDMELEEREIMAESRDVKMSFERQKHQDLRSIESEKLIIEKERLQMEKDNMIMKRQQIMAQKEQIQAQTNLEKSRIILLKMDMFKSRQAIKKDYPEVTEEYLNTHFPYPE